MSIHSFIDTNIFLRFLGYSSDDLEQLKKLAAALANNVVTLYLTEQVKNEYSRRREAEIHRVIKEARQNKIDESFPITFQSYPNYEDLREAINKFKITKDNLIQQVLSDAVRGKLLADQVIGEIFEAATAIQIDQEAICRAERRVALNNPPGKKGAGDAVNWELLLEYVPAYEGQFYLVTGDSDFASPLEPNKVSPFLAKEWESAEKKSELVLYTSLSQFFSVHFPDIQLATELEKHSAIEQLINSDSFQITHNAIAILSNYDTFSKDEVQSIAEAALENSQVAWISEDFDVYEFYAKIIRGYGSDLDDKTCEKLKEIFEFDANEIPL
jgi:predicted nucleic acid-binding protein